MVHPGECNAKEGVVVSIMEQQPLFMVRGTTYPISVVLTNEIDGSRPLVEGELLRFGIKKRREDEQCVVTKELDSTSVNEGTESEYIFVLSPIDTKELPAGRYYYDIGLQNGGEYINVVPCSEFHIMHNITSHTEVSA